MSQLIPRVGVGAVSSPMEIGADRAPAACDELARLLTAHGCEVVNVGALGTADAASRAGQRLTEAHIDALALVSASWYEDYLVLDLLEECDAPLLFWSLPGMETGALCGTQQITCYLKQLEKPYDAVFGPLQAGDGLTRALRFLRVAALKRRLRRARIGMAGLRTRGMTEVAVNEIALKKVLGPRIVPTDMVALLNRARNADAALTVPVWNRVKQAAGHAQVEVQVSEEAGIGSSGFYIAIQELVQQEGLSAFAFGCYPDYMGCACMAASLLADEGVPVGCEGDANGAVAMLILQLLTGKPTHNTDWLDPLADGSVIFTHCGSGSYTLADPTQRITLAPVRLACTGVCSLFPARPGPVTLLNLLPSGAGYQMAVMEGEALPTGMVFPGNPLRVQFATPTAHIIDWIHAEGVGHHWMAGYGHVAAELQALARMVGPNLRYLNPD
jgi:L-fucose isomerase-like protein